MEKVKVFYKQFSNTRIFCEHPKPSWKRVAIHGNVCEPILLSKGCDGFRDRDFKSSLPLIFEINHAPTIPKKPLGAIFFSAGLQSWFGWASFSAFVSCKFRLYTCLFYIYKVKSRCTALKFCSLFNRCRLWSNSTSLNAAFSPCRMQPFLGSSHKVKLELRFELVRFSPLSRIWSWARAPGDRASTLKRCVTAEVTDARRYCFVRWAFAHEIFKFIIIFSFKGAVSKLVVIFK